ncbi:unnamed protein product [Ectocarpus sp. 6 AP-2014]
MSQYQQHPAPASGMVDDAGEAFARAVFCRFLRQATISRDIDDVIEHMHIVNDDSQTFAIRLGGDARVPVSQELILALAAKKKELLALCESKLRTPRSIRGGGGHTVTGANATATGTPTAVGRPGLSSSLQHYRQQGNPSTSPPDPAAAAAATTHHAVVFPPPAALAAMQSSAMAAGSASVAVPVPRDGGGGGSTSGGGGGGGLGSVPAAMGDPATGGGVSPAVVPPLGVVVRHQQGEGVAAAAGPDPMVVEGSGGGGGDGDGSVEQSEVSAESSTTPSRPSPPPPPRPPTVTRVAAAAPAFVPTAAAAGWRQRDPAGPTTLFVRKIDMKVDREDVIKHFSIFGQVLSVSMNPSRGYAFVDLDSHDAVLRAVRTAEHTVGRKTLQVEVKKEPATPKSRGNNSSNNPRHASR